MSSLENLTELKKELLRCMKCGMCMSVCPIYEVELKESSIARAKIALGEAYLKQKIKNGTLIHLIYNCLFCKSCRLACPSGVKYDKIILNLRELLAKDFGKPWIKKIAFWLIRHPVFFSSMFRAFSKIQGLFFEQKDKNLIVPKEMLKLFGRRFDKKFFLPKFPLKDFKTSSKEVWKQDPSKGSVLFFIGCGINYLYPGIAEDLIYVLMKNRFTVYVPKQQQCCGMPVMVHGDLETARELARKNLDLFEKISPEYIITACASCGSALKVEYEILLENDPRYREITRKWKDKVLDFTTFFINQVKDFKFPRSKKELKVTYHDPCHLRKSMNVFKEPRALIKSLEGIEFIEMKKPDRCCGSGGSYHLFNPEVSLKILRNKMEDIRKTEAEVVLTECPACIMQLTEGAIRFEVKVKVKHVVTFLAENYKQE